MFSDYQLRSFERYVKTTPKHLLGVFPVTAKGAYDALHGRAAHGFGQRRGIPGAAFKRGGAFAYDAGGENDEENPSMSKYGQSLVALEKYLRQILSTEQMQEVAPLIETVCHHCKVEAMNDEDDGELDMEGEDRRRARDNRPPFAGSPRTNADPDYVTKNSNASLPNRSNRGSAMDGRPGRMTQAAADSFAKLFPNASTVKHV